MDNQSYLSNADISTIDALYAQYNQDPSSIDISWQRFFEGFDFRGQEFPLLPTSEKTSVPLSSTDTEKLHKEFRVLNLINDYRTRGHLFTKTNPVRARRKHAPNLDLKNYELSEADLDTQFVAGKEIGLQETTLRKILEHLTNCYCESVGVEYMYIRNPERQHWLRDRIEAVNKTKFSVEEKKQIFEMTSKASLFEQYIHKKFVGQKRFSAEGVEAVIPAIDSLVRRGAAMGVREFVIGMAHRGRLNVISNIMGKPYDEIFREFDGAEYDEATTFDGDVKYHLGYTHHCEVEGKSVHITLCPNPSHLEAVNPVAEGLTRAKIDNYLIEESAIVPVLVHGDAAIAGQGVMYEIIQMALLDGYRVGGTVHIVTNNQVGFTTNYLDGRSSTYCTDVAKTTLCPVFHVNADDVEAVVHTVQLALEYRQRWHMDVFIDLLGYRKYGHNEGDEPKFTQPSLYKMIASHKSLRDIYKEKLVQEGSIDESYAEDLKKNFETKLDEHHKISRKESKAFVKHFLETTWKNFRTSTVADFDSSPDTRVDKSTLLELGKKMNTLPEGEKFFNKTARVFSDRLKMIDEDNLDWGMGEMLAYASLLAEGHPVRLSGQDVERGTFSHRHAVIKTDEDAEKEFILLNWISKGQAEMTVYNSLLSEYGVLGFDYGYAFGTPHGLTIWEAQFGDFNNGAQIIIDQFISAAEDKWRTMNGITLFLPHGYEGQGSEHSSGRMERYLQLCAENNMYVCNPTTPANFFHLLRRQVKTEFRKPLIVFTPKKLLRYPKAISSINEMASGRFMELIDDPAVNKKEVDTIAFCSGKVYYEILEEKEKLKIGNNIAVIRLEQLYPLPEKQMRELISSYGKKTKFLWVQEEPENMGAWGYIMRVLRDLNLELISLPASASPATGSSKVHEVRMKVMMGKLFEITG